jgi:hypothetical protein
MSDLLSCTTKLDEPRVLYVSCSASRELRGLMEWSIPWIPSSRLFMSCVSPRVSYVSIPHVEYARQGYAPFKRRMSEVGRCPCRGLMHGCRFYSERYCLWTLSWVLAWKVRCVLWSSAGTLTSFRKSLSKHRLAIIGRHVYVPCHRRWLRVLAWLPCEDA